MAQHQDLEDVVFDEASKSSAAPENKGWGKKRVIAIAVVLATVLGGGSWAYAAYQAPRTVVGMAIGSLFNQPNSALELTLKASAAALGSQGSLKIGVASDATGVDLNALLNLEIAGQAARANLETIATAKGDVYLQLSDFDSALSLLAIAQLEPAQISAISETISGKWVKISKSEIDQLAIAGSEATCIQEKFEDPKLAGELSAEIVALAKANDFLKVSKELGVKDGKLGYELTLDAAALKAGLLGFIETKAFDEIEKCAAQGSSLISKVELAKSIQSVKVSEIEAALNGTKVTIWADQWTHKLSKFTLNVTETSLAPGVEFSAELLPHSGESKKFEVPKGAISIANLQNQLLGGFATVP
ncbi:MAG: hypothetical protein RL196_904 [Actinomycetota bacterium]